MLKSGLYNMIGAGIRLVSSLLTIPLLIRIIGVEQYGLWTLVSAVIAILGLAEAGFSISTTAFLSRDLARNDRAGAAQTCTLTIGGIIVLALLACVGMWILAPWLTSPLAATDPKQSVEALVGFQLAGVVVATRLLQQVCVSIEQSFERFGPLNVINTTQTILVNVGVVLAAYLGLRVAGMMAFVAVVSVAFVVVHGMLVQRLLQPLDLRPAWNRARAWELARFGLPTWLGTLGGVAFTQLDRVIVGAVLGLSSLGVYAAITSVATQINTLSALPVQPLLPGLSQVLQRQSSAMASIRTWVRQATQINAFVAVGVGSVLYTLAPLVTRFIGIDTSSEQHTLVFRLAALAYTIYSLNAVGYYLLFSAHATRAFMAIQLASGIFSVALIAIGAHALGLVGATIGNFGYSATLLFCVVGMHRVGLPVRLWVLWLLPPAGVLLFAIAGVQVGQNQPVWLLALAALQSVVLALWFFAAQRREIMPTIHRYAARLRA